MDCSPSSEWMNERFETRLPLLNLFTSTSKIHTYNTRFSTSNKFHIKKSRLEMQQKAVSRIGAKVWNVLPVLLRDLPKKQFKKKLHTALIEILQSHDDYIDVSQISTALRNRQFWIALSLFVVIFIFDHKIASNLFLVCSFLLIINFVIEHFFFNS